MGERLPAGTLPFLHGNQSYPEILKQRNKNDTEGRNHENGLVPSPSKRFSTSAARVSEAELAEGFRFPVKESNRPGQFSERPAPKKRTDEVTRATGASIQPLPLGISAFSSSDIGLSTSNNRVSPTQSKNHAILQTSQFSEKTSSLSAQKMNSSPHNSASETQIVLELSLPVASLAGLSPKTGHADDQNEVLESLQNLSPPRIHKERPSAHGSSKKGSQSRSNPGISQTASPTTQRKGHSARVRHCGDLEGPLVRSPLKPVHTPQYRISKCHKHMPSRGSPQIYFSPVPRPGSQSSNISKRRSTSYLGEINGESDRKRQAMKQVAQYWNKCVQISNEENAYAASEIDKLQAEMQQQRKQLNNCNNLLTERDKEVENLSKRCLELERQRAEGAESKEMELVTLHEEMSKMKAQAELTRGKYNNCRDALNAAIKEQQDLYKRTSDSHKNLLSEGKWMAEQREADSKAVKKALKFNARKRNELLTIISELKRDMQNVEDGKNATIASLEEKIRLYEQQLSNNAKTLLCFEKNLEYRRSIEGRAAAMDEKLESILQGIALHKNGQHINTKLAHNIDDRLVGLESAVANCAKTKEEQHSTAQVDELADRLIQRILPKLNATVATQNAFNEKILSCGATIQGDVLNMRQQIQQGGVNVSEIVNQQNNERQELLSAVMRIGQEQNVASDCLENIASSLDVIAKCETGTNERLEDGLSQLRDVVAQLFKNEKYLIQRTERIGDDRDQQTADLAALKQQLAMQSEVSLSQLKDSLSGLHARLDTTFQKAAENSEQELERHRALFMDAIDSFTRAKECMVADLTGSQEQSAALQHAIRAEQDRVAALEEKIQQLEKEKEDESKQSHLWQKKAATIEATRLHLDGLEKRLAHIVQIPSRLEELCDLSCAIQATAQYMDNENQWLMEQLHERTVDLQEQRKVIVHSPALHVRSPSPLSVEQEQQQRREGVRPRSILKGSQSSADGSNSGESQNRGRRSAQFIEEIRSNLLQTHSLKRVPPLSTITDFVNAGKIVGRGETCSSENGDDVAERGLKRRKSEFGPEPVMVG